MQLLQANRKFYTRYLTNLKVKVKYISTATILQMVTDRVNITIIIR